MTHSSRDMYLCFPNDPCGMEALRSCPVYRASLCQAILTRHHQQTATTIATSSTSTSSSPLVLSSDSEVGTFFHVFSMGEHQCMDAAAKVGGNSKKRSRVVAADTAQQGGGSNDADIIRFHFFLSLLGSSPTPITALFSVAYSTTKPKELASSSSSVEQQQQQQQLNSSQYHQQHFHTNDAYRYYMTSVCYRLSSSPQASSSSYPNAQGFGAWWYAKWSHKQNIRMFWIHNQMCKAQTLGGGWASVKHPLNSLYYAILLYRLALMIQDAACIRKCRLFLGYACLWSSEQVSSDCSAFDSPAQARQHLQRQRKRVLRRGSASTTNNNGSNGVASPDEDMSPASAFKDSSLSIAARIFTLEGKAAEKTRDTVQKNRCEAALFVLEHDYRFQQYQRRNKNSKNEPAINAGNTANENGIISGSNGDSCNDHSRSTSQVSNSRSSSNKNGTQKMIKPAVDVFSVDDAWEKAFSQAKEV